MSVEDRAAADVEASGAKEPYSSDQDKRDASIGPAITGDMTLEELGVDEKALVRKLDKYLLWLVMSLYLFSFLDRVNIGNARLYHFEEDLGLVGNQFQIAVSILFVTYITFEVPSNLVIQKFTPRYFIAFITIGWGIVATLTGLVQNYGGLIACRLILGALEAGLFPGMNIFLTLFYTKHELAMRVGYLFVSAAIAGALGGLLAFGIGHMDGIAGMHGWRWIMIVEGIPTIILGICVFFFLPNNAETAYFLTENEKKAMVIRRARQYGHTTSAQQFSKKDMNKAFADWKVWLFSAGQFGADTCLYGFSTFLPTIIRGIGTWSNAEVQLLTIPCYFLGAVSYMTTAYWSDRTQKRGVFCVGFALTTCVGYAILISPLPSGAHYFGCFLVATGLYVLVGLPLAWLPSNSPRYGKRTTANGLQLTIGNSSGIMAPFIYETADAPRYIRGHATTLAMVAMAGTIYGTMSWWLARENRLRDEGKIKPEHQGLTEDEMAELGDESPRFRYAI
ncbi:uncharacterized protein PgNI_09129 [Pyricularia grisea]|uniref:Major facilitator superfamily (MFS) profile domain-containing protein n=1 Tax=Pyricularia grisea TaxID=148305 RepID=A0A6P8ASS5_PYRGI|nr:uncharacterized protein PgNI_09129 [Pyricularia grisea]TLD05176.1 hypothetical protein PgNI_09129 [Pyricularia grisea]